jgi:hypothetical protein
MRLFRRRQLEVVPRQTKLFHLFKLVHSKDTANVLLDDPAFLPETGRNTAYRSGSSWDRSAALWYANGLFRSGNEVSSILHLIVRLARNLYSCSSKSSNCAICAMTLFIMNGGFTSL